MQLKKEPTPEYETAWKGDQLERKIIANYLTPVIGSIRQPFVISLNSEYGTGKTFFIRNWRNELENTGFKAVYFNAWETDYAEDALIAFISSIKHQLESSKDKNSKDITELAKKGGAYVTRKVLPIIARGVARKVIGNETVEEFISLSDRTDEDVVNIFGDIAEESLRKHEVISLSIDAFKKDLGTLVHNITEKADHDDKKKLIIFIDELDRCRPTYAVEVLECIKHLFNIPGVVFILAIDLKQLKTAIASVYGTQTDGEAYLRKFIDWQLTLPKPSATKYSAYLFYSFRLEETGRFKNGRDYSQGKDTLIKSFGIFSHSFELSLREQAQCFTEINLSIRSLAAGVEYQTYLTGIIPVLRLKCSKHLEDCVYGRSDPEKLVEFVQSKLDLKLYGNEIRDWHQDRALFHAFFTNDHFRTLIDREQKTLIETQNKLATASKRLEDEKQQRLDYLNLVISCHQTMRGGRTYTESEARIIYDRFEIASTLI